MVVIATTLAVSRIIRSSAIGLRSQVFVEAARSLGAGQARIPRLHVLPPIIVNASIRMGEVVLLSSTLAFLGFGPPPPFPSCCVSGSGDRTHPVRDALGDVLDPRVRHVR